MRKFGYFLYYPEKEEKFIKEANCLGEAGCSPVLYDRYSGRIKIYPSFNLLLRTSKKHDIIVVRSLDHFFLSADHLIRIIVLLRKHKLHLQVLEQSSIDTVKYGYHNVYSIIIEFCNYQLFFNSDANKLKGRSSKAKTGDKIRSKNKSD